MSMDRWNGMRILDLFSAVAAGKAEESSRKSFIRSATEQLETILYMASPFSEDNKHEEATKELSMDQKLVLLSKLNSNKDKSDQAIMQTLMDTMSDVSKKAN